MPFAPQSSGLATDPTTGEIDFVPLSWCASIRLRRALQPRRPRSTRFYWITFLRLKLFNDRTGDRSLAMTATFAFVHGHDPRVSQRSSGLILGVKLRQFD